MRLLHIVISKKETNVPNANALMALFCFQASRFDARINQEGEQILYNEQDSR
jgi:predicted RNA polymerase sigma factor